MTDDREALVELVRKIMEAGGTEGEIDQWIEELQSRVSHPSVTDLIFHGERDYSAEEVVDLALKYRPTALGQ
jgi:hypothetical protein